MYIVLVNVTINIFDKADELTAWRIAVRVSIYCVNKAMNYQRCLRILTDKLYDSASRYNINAVKWCWRVLLEFKQINAWSSEFTDWCLQTQSHYFRAPFTVL